MCFNMNYKDLCHVRMINERHKRIKTQIERRERERRGGCEEGGITVHTVYTQCELSGWWCTASALVVRYYGR